MRVQNQDTQWAPGCEDGDWREEALSRCRPQTQACLQTYQTCLQQQQWQRPITFNHNLHFNKKREKIEKRERPHLSWLIATGLAKWKAELFRWIAAGEDCVHFLFNHSFWWVFRSHWIYQWRVMGEISERSTPLKIESLQDKLCYSALPSILIPLKNIHRRKTQRNLGFILDFLEN